MSDMTRQRRDRASRLARCVLGSGPPSLASSQDSDFQQISNFNRPGVKNPRAYLPVQLDKINIRSNPHIDHDAHRYPDRILDRRQWLMP